MPSILGETESVSECTKLDLRYVNQSGDKLQGSLNMGLNKIINSPTPTNPGDVANKDYVDICQRNTINKLPKMYGFQLRKTVTMSDYETQFLVTMPSGTDHRRVSLVIAAPEVDTITNKSISRTGNNILTEVVYRIYFKKPDKTKREYQIKVEGFVVIYPVSLVEVSGKQVHFALESGSLETSYVYDTESTISESMISESTISESTITDI